VGEQNPSLRSLTLTGATPSTMIGFNQLLTQHPRLLQFNCRILVRILNVEFRYFEQLRLKRFGVVESSCY
jgi:hypothetical protein